MKGTILLLLISASLYAQEVPTLSDRAQIHVITCGPGQYELYSAFGHNAFRVVDPLQQIDYIYDYGVFDFNQPNFYLNFARGNLNYRVARRDYISFRNFYIYYNRDFMEQRLDLTQEHKQALFQYLEWNNLPENRDYLYDYFYDNCATKIKDVVISALGDNVIFEDSHIAIGKSIRQLTDDYLMYQPWGDLGIDICLGLPMDVEASAEVHMFLPEYVQKAFDNAYTIESGERKPLVSRTFETYRHKEEVFKVSWFTPAVLFWLVFLLGSTTTILGYRKRKWRRAFDLILFGILGLLGLFLLLLWLATDHRAAANNLNLLWALPFHLYGFWLIMKRGVNTSKYFRVSLIWYIIIATSWFMLPQLMHYSLFPIALLAGIRSWYISYSLKYES